MAKFSDRVIDVFYNKTKRSVLLFFVLGFFLRFISARNLGVSADDVNHAIRPVGIFSSGKLVIFDQSTALWYYIQGIFYKLLGNSILVSRFASVVFGSLLIIAMFLFVKRVFKSEKAALISSFLVAISPLLIKNSMPEMDVTVSFFAIISAYFLFGFLESKQKKDLVLSAILIGTAVMIKLYALFLAISFILFMIYKQFKTERNTRKILKNVLIFGVIISILVIPTLTHNYLLYKDKGFMDLIFSNTLKLGTERAAEEYQWSAGWMPHSDYKGFFLGNQQNFDPTPLPGGLIVLGFLFKGDPLLFILGVLGIIFIFNRNRDYLIFFLLVFIPTFVYLGAQIPLAKHFVWALVFAAPAAGLVSEKIFDKLKLIKLKHILIIFLIFNLLYLGMPKGVSHSHFYGKSSFGQLVSYKEAHISENSLVVVDSRIYRGNIHYGLAGTNYLEATHFFDLANQANQAGQARSVEVFYVECVIDDCGWGTIHNQPEFNASMEKTTAWFANQSYTKIDFSAPNPHKYYLPFFGEKRTDYRIYKADLNLNPAILSAVKQTHTWFKYPIGYDRSIAPIFDDYNILSTTDSIISRISWYILYLELAIAYLAIFYILLLFINE